MAVWQRLVVLSLGAVLGVNARYWLGLGISHWAGSRFPWATFTINVSGSFAAGFAATLLIPWSTHHPLRLLILVGFLGTYTTFSAFTLESFNLWERGDYTAALANLMGSVAAGLVAVALGVSAGRGLSHGPAKLSAPVSGTEDVVRGAVHGLAVDAEVGEIDSGATA